MYEDLRELSDENTWSDVRQAATAIVYKHSTRCPTSWNAMREVEQFLQQTKDIPVFLVNVVTHRSLSQRIAEDLDVRHESPQAILLRSGEVAEHTSHRRITAALLTEWASAASDWSD